MGEMMGQIVSDLTPANLENASSQELADYRSAMTEMSRKNAVLKNMTMLQAGR